MALTLEVRGSDELATLLAGLPRHVYDKAKKAFTEAATKAHKETMDRVSGGQPLNRRTGALARSLNYEVNGNGESINSLNASVYSGVAVGEKPVIYAPVHEIGATIKAKDKYLWVKGGPYLNIPTPANLTAAGVTRMSARDVFANGGYVAGRAVFLRTVKLDVDAVPIIKDTAMFSLVKQVTIPARLGMRDTVTKHADTLLENLGDMLTGL